MKSISTLALCAALAGLVAVSSSPASAQQKKTKAECTKEWQANKAEYRANKVTEKAYVEKCVTGAATAAPSPAPAPARPPTAAPARPAAPAPAPSATAPQQAPAPSATAPQRTPAPGATAPRRAPSTAAAMGANQFASEDAAKARCPTDTIVYVNRSSKIYHFAGHSDYGRLKNGAFMCEKDTAAAGARAAKNEKHP